MRELRKQQYRKIMKLCKSKFEIDDEIIISGISPDYKVQFKVIESIYVLPYNECVLIFKNIVYYRGKHFATLIHGVDKFGKKFSIKGNLILGKYKKLISPHWIKTYS